MKCNLPIKELWTPGILGYNFLLKKPKKSTYYVYHESHKKYGITIKYYLSENICDVWISIFEHIFSFYGIGLDSVDSSIKLCLNNLLKNNLKKKENNFIKYLLQR